MQHPEIFEFLRFRCASMTRMFARIQQAVKAIKPTIDLRLNAFIYDYWELSGIEFMALRPHLGSIRSSNYDEQYGRMEMMEHKRQFLLAVRAAAGDDIHFLSSIGIRPQSHAGAGAQRRDDQRGVRRRRPVAGSLRWRAAAVTGSHRRRVARRRRARGLTGRGRPSGAPNP